MDRRALRKYVHDTSQREGSSEARHLLSRDHERRRVHEEHEESENRSETDYARRIAGIESHFSQHASDSRDTIHSETPELAECTDRLRRDHQTKGSVAACVELEIQHRHSHDPQGSTDEGSTKIRLAPRKSTRPHERTLHGNHATTA